jgi:hypothetical protein
MERRQDRQDLGSRLPNGITAREAAFLPELFARLKEKRFGRLEVTVSDGRVVDIQLIETFDRKLLPSLAG